MKEARVNIVEDIRKEAIKKRTIVEQLAEELIGRSPERIGIELVQSSETNELLEYAKESPEVW